MTSKQLSPVLAESNRKALIGLDRAMARYRLTKAQVADLLGVSRVLVTRWYKGEKRCPDNAADTIRMIMSIRSKESVQRELVMKRQELTKRRKQTPSYPCKD